MKRKVIKVFRLTELEAAVFAANAPKANLTLSAYFRMLIAEYVPKEKSDERF